MKILNEEEQLFQRVDEIFSMSCYQDCLNDRVEAQLRKAKDAIFTSQDKIGSLEFTLDKGKGIVKLLESYHEMLRTRAIELREERISATKKVL